jgi:5-methylcytosine-specific restriction protein A
MAVTHGHGNPNWTRDETILALDLYLECKGKVPSSIDQRVKELSDLLREFPYHARAARQPSFRNPDGVGFKLQNLRQVATGKGLGNVSKIDRAVWEELGSRPDEVRRLAILIREGVIASEATETEEVEDEFPEGRIVTEEHKRKERNQKLRKKLLKQRLQAGQLKCEICNCGKGPTDHGEAIFEAHHSLPIAVGGLRKTKLEDMVLLCANCHRLIHRLISKRSRWIGVQEARKLLGYSNA